jgi:hypothetical protein
LPRLSRISRAWMSVITDMENPEVAYWLYRRQVISAKYRVIKETAWDTSGRDYHAALARMPV